MAIYSTDYPNNYYTVNILLLRLKTIFGQITEMIQQRKQGFPLTIITVLMGRPQYFLNIIHMTHQLYHTVG